jgi:CRP-like cAMP-binding protein
MGNTPLVVHSGPHSTTPSSAPSVDDNSRLASRLPPDDQSPVLVKIPYFEDLSIHELKVLKQFFTLSKHEPGPLQLSAINPLSSAPFSQPPISPQRFFIIVRGSVDIIAESGINDSESKEDSKIVIRTLKQGEWFGDMALLEADWAYQAITAQVTEQTSLLSISNSRFNEFLEVAPALRAEIHASRRIGGVTPPPVQLKALPFFAGVDELKLQQLAVLLTLVRAPAGTVLFNQGDISDGFYILVKGTVTVTWRQPESSDVNYVLDGMTYLGRATSEKEVLLETLQAGSWFGEISLIQDSLRTATAKALQNCLLLFLEKSVFHKFVRYAPEVQGPGFQHVIQQRTSNMLKTLPFFSPLITKRVGPLLRFDEEKLQVLGQLFYYKTFEEDQVIFTEGEKGTAFYVLISGSCERTASRPQDGYRVSLGTLRAGDFFGELALLGDTLRTFTVYTSEKTTCLKLDQSQFQKFFEIAPELREPLESAIRIRTLETLKSISLFRDEVVENKPWSKLELLATLFDYEQAEAGDLIVEEGSEGEKFYLVVVGTVEVQITVSSPPLPDTPVNHFKLIDLLRAGDYFGEMALLQRDGIGIRAASVRAKEPCMFLTLSKEKFSMFISLVPEAQASISRLSESRSKKVLRQKSPIASEEKI